jgi:probable DNA metabolism protein
MNYLYDGSFEGFLTCVFEHYYTEKADGIFLEGAYQLDLTRRAASLATDPAKAERVYAAIHDKISVWDAERIYRVHCTSEPEKEMHCLRYIELGFRIGGRLRLMHGDDVVLAVQKAEQRLGTEVNRLLGLVRFSEKLIATSPQAKQGGGSAASQSRGDGTRKILYASIEPDNDCLEFLAPHFSDRLKEEPFLIHDLRRGKALASYRKQWDIAELPADAGFLETPDEAVYAELWRKYFDVMAIRERTNPRCQRNFLPTRYRKHLTEMRSP